MTNFPKRISVQVEKLLNKRTGFIFFFKCVYLKQISLRVSNSIGMSPIKIISLSNVNFAGSAGSFQIREYKNYENFPGSKILKLISVQVSNKTV